MSQHSSLKASNIGNKHRNVLKRYERIRQLIESEKWKNRETVYNLPKQKLIKMKVKKSKEKAEEGAEGEAATSAPAKGAPAAKAATPAAKGAAPAKGAKGK